MRTPEPAQPTPEDMQFLPRPIKGKGPPPEPSGYDNPQKIENVNALIAADALDATRRARVAALNEPADPTPDIDDIFPDEV